ncbi:MAG: hypothetical protein LBD73_00720 [Deferribacteraceae bacterium]|jgi:hypothetical protein|nr:hypothetical protein [Deferribacteraceae bacterium]
MKKLLSLIFSVLCLQAVAAVYAYASESLFFLEAQGIIGYSSLEDKIVYRSSENIYEPMQKNSVGFDYIRKISSDNGEFGTFALQTRLAYNADEDKPEYQIYNAFLKLKSSVADVWIGHNRTAFGLASYTDTHSELLMPLTAYGYGYERDWGLGLQRDFQSSDIRFSLTTATGMPIEYHGNYLAALRYSYGVLGRDNYNAGISFLAGETQETRGFEFASHELHSTYLADIDFTYLGIYGFEYRIELIGGIEEEEEVYAACAKIGLNWLNFDGPKIESQFVFSKKGDVTVFSTSLGASYLLTSSLKISLMYEHMEMSDDSMKNMGMSESKVDNRVVAQIYFYK